MKSIALIAIALFTLTGCAHTTLYSQRTGKTIARFEGDMKGLTFRSSPDGTVEWSALEVSHSQATLAQGKAASDKITAVGGAVATAGIMALFK